MIPPTATSWTTPKQPSSGRASIDRAGSQRCSSQFADGTPFGPIGIYFEHFVDEGDQWRFKWRLFQTHYASTPDLAGSFFDVLAIPKDASNVKEAHAFINYLLQPEVIAQVSDQVGYANPNPGADKLMEQSIRTDAAVYPPQAVLERTFVNFELPPKVQRLMTRSWTKVKTGK